ncbi:breast carcinoma amplified sequence 2-domain-containing protein [Syncephalis pseudoplumigaleata]|uniref:Breast carcinoma amplified sequence 2-domain-containing protein n=1 Tax=Syncephalis pseudoplumigaleata TaxID=1712513 RepID=A0A4V1J174_9FUNG|nr:breast carcinoma amplified sequence 2-domain-containing protein [Syncephalis pseudoplumigaleata]|eukprot:RKP24069.1 breast carcinoma amplified sequence 2-domain-containing protein [Syncephalis pseudoplumigaleata]
MKAFSFDERNRLPVASIDALLPSEEGALWKQTLARMKDGKEKLDALDMARYRMPAALDDDADLQAWQELCRSTETQLQHQHLRLCNLELLQKFGNNAWRMHNYQVEGQVEGMKRMLETEKGKVVECNQARKAMQLEAGEKLRKLEERWQSLIGQNAHLEVACAALEKEIKDWQAYKDGLASYQQQQEPATS